MGGSAPHGDKEGHGKGKDKGKKKGKGKGKGDLPDEFDEWAQTMPVVPTRYWDKDKKRKLKLYKFDKKQYIFNKMNPVTKPKPSPWPIEYGWEIDYHW
ncbi:hypothetical protein HF086_014217 [Spodoptera exigua]|uniref:Uncharacterized protein n=1 Tax=Spodoptera exigua TaxID=7107 RepID=A0A922SGK3_SPOEX|nr:hypothetical protein HF086_014217 [Spodoptera exigua]